MITHIQRFYSRKCEYFPNYGEITENRDRRQNNDKMRGVKKEVSGMKKIS